MIILNILSIISGICGIIGTTLSVYFYRKSKKDEIKKFKRNHRKIRKEFKKYCSKWNEIEDYAEEHNLDDELHVYINYIMFLKSEVNIENLTIISCTNCYSKIDIFRMFFRGIDLMHESMDDFWEKVKNTPKLKNVM